MGSLSCSFEVWKEPHFEQKSSIELILPPNSHANLPRIHHHRSDQFPPTATQNLPPSINLKQHIFNSATVDINFQEGVAQKLQVHPHPLYPKACKTRLCRRNWAKAKRIFYLHKPNQDRTPWCWDTKSRP